MPEPLRFHRQVASDLHNATWWYESISIELVNRFRENVDARLDDIAASPQSFAFAFSDIRFARIRRFPYIIVFQEVDDLVNILGVFHGASNLTSWKRRTRN